MSEKESNQISDEPNTRFHPMVITIAFGSRLRHKSYVWRDILRTRRQRRPSSSYSPHVGMQSTSTPQTQE
jgi:hypothetical protein